MAYLGLLFKLNETSFSVVFILKPKAKHDVIIGFENFLPRTKIIQKLVLNNNLEFFESPFNVNDKIRYSKISLSDRTTLDYEDNLFWFNPKKYRILKQVLEVDSINNFENDIKIRINDIYDFFK